MKSALDYFALFLAFAPASALLAVVICADSKRFRRFIDRHLTKQLGNHYRDESWHTQGRTAPTKFRTHR